MKQHLAVLDGLRGTAAISVVLFHFQELIIGFISPDQIWFRHAYMAVDFFFCLSGYVIAYAYDDRRDSMSVRDFLTARLIRLHPMVVLGVVLGLLSYLLDPFNRGPGLPSWMEVQNSPLWKLIGSTVGGLLMLPTWGLANRFGSYVSLNSPAWSLMWEYAANIAFAFFLWRMKKTVLAVVIVLGAIGVGLSAHSVDHLWLGYAWGQMFDACVRTVFSFCMGLMLFRCGAAIRTPLGFGSLSVIMVMLFIAPVAPFGCPNWIYESVMAWVIFPLMVAVGAGAEPPTLIKRICDFCGRVSYPIYSLHYATVMVFVSYYWTHGISREALPWVITGLVIFVILTSYAALVLYDEPVRRRLKEIARARGLSVRG